MSTSMRTDMNIQIIAPCFYPDEYYVRYFITSAKRHGIKPYMYGFLLPFRDWIDTHITECLRVLKTECVESTHILFTDASDAIFMQGLDEIQRRYFRLGKPPMLVSDEETGLNAGGWLGEREVAIEVLEYLAKQTDGSGNPQDRWRAAVDYGQVFVRYDFGHVIFQVATNAVQSVQSPQALADTCVLHFAGGFTDRVVGKQAQIEPLWKTLGYEDFEDRGL
jgi:hypothetical protein